MLFGHDKLIKIFKGLADNDSLSHGYIFFGDPQIGKATFGKYLANYLEFGEFAEPTGVLTECLNISPEFKNGDGIIGIDAVRDIKQFLYSKPVRSKRRMVILDEAQSLTPQAQNAILKMAEEPPKSGLLVMIVSNPDSVLATLQSRFQKIYFPRLSNTEVKEFLMKEMKVSAKEAATTAILAFGRIGRAKEIISNKNLDSINKEVIKFLKGGSYQKELIKKLVEPDNKAKLKLFLEELVANLSTDPIKNQALLQATLKRLTLMAQFNVNKRLQLESGLIWNI